MTFDPDYVSQVLRQHFEDAKAQFLAPLMAIHSAHLVMLHERGIVATADARRIRDALDAICLDDVRKAPYDGTSEDLFFYVERLIAAACGDDVAGRLRVARSRNDIDMTMYRMRQREGIREVAEAVLDLRATLLDLASQHRDTLLVAYTHTQPAQPTTVAHYLLAVVEQLERDVRRIRAAYASTNQCPLGACAITGTGFPIDRQRTSELLGFDAPTGNTYGSIATVDYLLESVAAASVLLVGLGRVVQDLLLWCTPEFGYLRLADGFVQGSSIMPQKRNPVALEHARAIASRAVGQAGAVMASVHNTPFGDIVDTEDDLQPLALAVLCDARRVVTLLSASLRHAELDVSRLEARTVVGGITLTELADHLVRDRDVPFNAAHAIAAEYDRVRSRLPEMTASAALAQASQQVLGTTMSYPDETLARITSPRHFVEVRSTFGGPASDEVTRALVRAHDLLAHDRQWLATTQAALEDANVRRRRRSEAL